MRKCINCGQEQNDNTRFCARCGTELKENTTGFYPPVTLVQSESGRDLIEAQYKEHKRNLVILDVVSSILFILILFSSPIAAYVSKGRIRESDWPSIEVLLLCLIIFLIPVISLQVVRKRAQDKAGFYRSLATKEVLTVETYGVTGECEQGRLNLAYRQIKHVRTVDMTNGKRMGDWILENPVLIITDLNEKCYKFYTLSNQNQIRVSIVNQIIRQNQEI